jgi:DNA repair protein RecO (recombination protein O)
MSIVRDKAVVLGRLDYSETSQVLVLFARRHGKVRVIAKGIKRGTKTRFAAGVDLLDIGDVCFIHRADKMANLSTLTEWKQTRSLSGLREKLSRIQGAQYVAEITGKLTEEFDPHTALYDSIIATLEALAVAPQPVEVVTHYQLRLLCEVGSLPRFDACMACHRGDDLTHFSSLQGGMICRHCEQGILEKWEVSDATHTAMLHLLRTFDGHYEPVSPCLPATDAARPNNQSVALFTLFNYHIAHLMGRQPQLAPKLAATPSRRIAE